MSTVHFDMLTYQQNGLDYTLTVGTPFWYEWLTTNSNFTYTSEYGTFTARKERSGSLRGGWYWKAYRKHGGKLNRAYLGKSEDLTLERLISVAQMLAAVLQPKSDEADHKEQKTRSSSFNNIAQESVLTTKLYVPPTRSDTVSRSHLIDRLNEQMRYKLVLVSAPAGFGKTNLLSSWCNSAKSSEWRMAWVSLDAADNDLTRFWSYVITALKTSVAEISDTNLALVRSPQPIPIESILVTLINTLTALPNDIALILDDYHLIEAPSIHNALMYLIDHLPPQLHLVIMSRIDPPLPIARLRAQGHLAELRMTDLRFTLDEAAKFLNSVMDLHLSTDEIALLEAKTEGWIAGLHLAALALQGHSNITEFVEAFTGKHRYVLDYLGDEVLKRQPEHIQAFLLQTSILDRLSGPLCDVVTGCADSEAVLDHLERANLFLVPLDEERSWYRYHHLFAEVLQSHLKQIHPSRIAELHARAARWYERHKLVADAVRHALAAAEFAFAVQLIEQSAETLMKHGEVTTLLTWLRALPADLLRTQPLLSVFHAWALTTINHLDAAEVSLQDAERVLREAVPQPLINAGNTADARPNGIRHLQGEVAAIRAVIASLQGNVPRTIECARQALECLPQENVLLRGTTALSLGRAYLWSGDLEAAEHILAEARAINQAAGNTFAALDSLYNQGHLYGMQGQLHRAAEIYQAILDDPLQQGGGAFHLTSLVYIGLGELLYEWYELEAAEEYLLKGIELGKQWGFAGSSLHSSMSLALVKQARGDLDGARTLQQQIEQAVERDNLSHQMATIIRAFCTRLEIAQGNREVASRWILEAPSVVDEPSDILSDFEHLTRVRAYLALGQYSEARRSLEPLLRGATQQRSMVEGLILLALALQGQNEVEKARTTLAHALELAEPEGSISIFVSEGQPMAVLLTQLLNAQRKERSTAARHISPGYIRKLLAVLRGETLSSSKDTPHQGTVKSPGETIESLSERELEVLQHLAAGMSNQAIAQKFIVSVGTIKTHLNHIYGKLNVHSRTQAVARARALHLLVGQSPMPLEPGK